MSKSEEKTIKYYDDHAPEWSNNTHFRFPEEMQKFHKLLPSGRVLEIGSGSGLDAINLIKLGYEYFGIDASSGLLNVARKRNPEGNFKLVKAQDLVSNFEDDYFNGFWTVATLLHVPKSEIKGTLEGMNRVVKNGGIGFIVVKQGEGEKEDEKGRMFTYYSQSEFSDLLEKSGFRILEKDIEPTEGTTTWLKFFVKVEK